MTCATPHLPCPCQALNAVYDPERSRRIGNEHAYEALRELAKWGWARSAQHPGACRAGACCPRLPCGHPQANLAAPTTLPLFRYERALAPDHQKGRGGSDAGSHEALVRHTARCLSAQREGCASVPALCAG